MHADPELLGLLALGEWVGTEDDRVHAETCPECARELSELQRVVTVGRSGETTLDTPSPAVWDRIREDLGLGLTLDSPPAPTEALEWLTVPPFGDTATTAKPKDALTAHAQLKPIAGSWSNASGTAQLATDDHGRRLLQVALHADLPASGVRQAWLVHRDDPSLRQTLGILDGPHGLWTVEHSIDLQSYGILEISQQGTGETEHSGQTIVRGEFSLVN
jgi:hypothetical protein